MMSILLWPFQFVWSIISFVFNLVIGVIGAVFGLVGGLIGFLFGGLVFLLVIIGVLALIRWFVIGSRRCG